MTIVIVEINVLASLLLQRQSGDSILFLSIHRILERYNQFLDVCEGFVLSNLFFAITVEQSIQYSCTET